VNGSSPELHAADQTRSRFVLARASSSSGSTLLLEDVELRLVAEEARLVDRDPVEHLLELVGLVGPIVRNAMYWSKSVELELLSRCPSRLSRTYFFVSGKWIPARS
jgi:hypothetical protein